MRVLRGTEGVEKNDSHPLGHLDIYLKSQGFSRRLFFWITMGPTGVKCDTQITGTNQFLPLPSTRALTVASRNYTPPQSPHCGLNPSLDPHVLYYFRDHTTANTDHTTATTERPRTEAPLHRGRPSRRGGGAALRPSAATTLPALDLGRLREMRTVGRAGRVAGAEGGKSRTRCACALL